MLTSMPTEHESWLDAKLRDPEYRAEFATEWPVMEFVEQVEEAIERTGTTKAALAERLGRSRAFVTQVLRRGRNLTVKTMAQLATALGYDVHISLVPASAGVPELQWGRRTSSTFDGWGDACAESYTRRGEAGIVQLHQRPDRGTSNWLPVRRGDIAEPAAA